MKTLGKLKILFCLVIVCLACSEKLEINDEAIQIDLSNHEELVEKESIIKAYKYVPLETVKGNLIGKIDKILTFEDRIYILDKIHSRSIVIFDTTGKFISRFNKSGKGPGEYFSMADFEIDEQKRHLVIYDFSWRKIFRYNIETLNFVENGAFDPVITNFAFDSKNNIFCFYRGNKDHKNTKLKYNLILADSALKIKDKFFKYDPNEQSFIDFKFKLFRSQDILHTRNFDYNIYCISPNGVKTKYRLDFGELSLTDPVPFKDKLAKAPSLGFILQDQNYAYMVENAYENKNFFVCTYKIGRKEFRLVYDKNTGNYKVIRGTGVFEVHDDGMHLWGKFGPYAVLNGSFVGFIDHKSNYMLQLQELTNRIPEYEHKYPKNYKMLEHFGASKNPVLIFYTFKPIS